MCYSVRFFFSFWKTGAEELRNSVKVITFKCFNKQRSICTYECFSQFGCFSWEKGVYITGIYWNLIAWRVNGWRVRMRLTYSNNIHHVVGLLTTVQSQYKVTTAVPVLSHEVQICHTCMVLHTLLMMDDGSLSVIHLGEALCPQWSQRTQLLHNLYRYLFIFTNFGI